MKGWGGGQFESGIFAREFTRKNAVGIVGQDLKNKKPDKL
jgi:hypothetical protein